MAKEAITKALVDANIKYDQVEQAVAGYCYGDSTCGQRALYQLGLTQVSRHLQKEKAYQKKKKKTRSRSPS